MNWHFKGELTAVGVYIFRKGFHVFSNCVEFVMESSTSLETVNDQTELICDEPKIRVSFIEQHDGFFF